MKRTCETCAHLHQGHECILHFGSPKEVDKKDPACKDYDLSFSELKWALVDSLDKARKKHPDFVPLPGPECASMYATRALIAKTDLESRVATGYGALPAVLLSECHEFMSALAVGDFKHALAEAGDVMAVMYRAINGEGKQEESK